MIPKIYMYILYFIFSVFLNTTFDRSINGVSIKQADCFRAAEIHL